MRPKRRNRHPNVSTNRKEAFYLTDARRLRIEAYAAKADGRQPLFPPRITEGR